MCPTSGTMYLYPEVVDMVSDIESFLHYPWGRKSFLPTVQSAKSRTVSQFVQETIALQGFSHATFLLTTTNCAYLVIEIVHNILFVYIQTVAAVVEWIQKRNDISSSCLFLYLTP